MSSVAKDSVSTLAALVASFILTFASGVIVARWLGPAGQGQLSILVSFLGMLINVVGPAVGMANVYHVASKRLSVGHAWGASLLIGTCCGLLGIAVGAVLVVVKTSFLASVTAWHCYLILASLPFVFLAAYQKQIIQGIGRIRLMNALSVASNAMYLGAVVVLLILLHMGLEGAVFARLLWGAIPFALFFAALWGLDGLGRIRLTLKAVGKSMKYGVKMHLGKLMSWTNNRVDVLIAGMFLNMPEVGLYAIAVALTEKLWLVPDSLGVALFPRIAGDAAGRPDSVAVGCRVSLMMMTALAAILATAGEKIIQLLYGPAFADAFWLMLLILPGTLAFGVSRMLTVYLAGINRPGALSLAMGAAAVTNIAMNFVLIPRLGIIGAPLSSSISYSAQAGILALLYAHHSGLRLGSLFVVRIADVIFLRDRASKLLTRRGACAR